MNTGTVKHIRHVIGWGLLLPAMAITSAYAQSDALLIRRSTELREGPAEASRSVAPLAVQTAVTRLPARQGAWIQVRTAAGATGWVHMFDVGASTTAPPAANTATGCDEADIQRDADFTYTLYQRDAYFQDSIKKGRATINLPSDFQNELYLLSGVPGSHGD